MKICSVCKIHKPLNDFSINPMGKDGHYSQCKECKAGKSKGFYFNHKPQVRVTQRAYERRTRKTEYFRQKRYNVSPEQYKAQWEKQAGLCAICRREMKRPQTDHDHMTGKFRGILCWPCNLILGIARDQVTIFLACVRYLWEDRP